MVLTYNALDDSKKLMVVDILSKKEALDGGLADIQTERATAEIAWTQREQTLRAEHNKLTEELRIIRKVTDNVV